MSSPFAFPLAALLALLSLVAAEGLLALDSSEGFLSLRSCALGCYNGGIRDGYMVTGELSCQKPGVVYVPPDNDCWCRPDLQETAVRYLSKCAYTSCSQNQRDVASATQVYKDYCTSAGYTAATPNSTPAQTTAGGRSPVRLGYGAGILLTLSVQTLGQRRRAPPALRLPAAVRVRANLPAAARLRGLALAQ